jgi:hypothetical protein
VQQNLPELVHQQIISAIMLTIFHRRQLTLF